MAESTKKHQLLLLFSEGPYVSCHKMRPQQQNWGFLILFLIALAEPPLYHMDTGKTSPIRSGNQQKVRSFGHLIKGTEIRGYLHSVLQQPGMPASNFSGCQISLLIWLTNPITIRSTFFLTFASSDWRSWGVSLKFRGFPRGTASIPQTSLSYLQ